MIRRVAHWSAQVALILPVTFAWLGGCDVSNTVVAQAGPVGFADEPDAGGDASDLLGEVPMCPVTTCASPRATCPDSKSPCDVDLMTDNENCGACGVRCGSTSFATWWNCVAGECRFSCYRSQLDCDHDPSTGCEVNANSDSDNCGDCGVRCPEGAYCSQGRCNGGCRAANKPDICNRVCTNLGFDPQNCGACGQACDPTGPNLPALPDDMFYGCAYGSCGARACAVANKADCNDDLGDGCEATLHTNEHCGTCGDRCAPGKECKATADGSYACLCEDDSETYCDGICQQLADDPQNCGGCRRTCPGLFLPHYEASCLNGVCYGKCADGWADCDGVKVELANGCEVDTRVDNRHCGACGHACLPSQVCADGKCVVAPCDGGSPEDPTR